MIPAIFGMQGHQLSQQEQGFFKEVDPLGYILFARNIDNRQQLSALTDTLRDISGRDDVPILIDQEGGRVARLSAPQWWSYPTAAALSAAFTAQPELTETAVRLNYSALGLDLAEVGISVDCAPVLDVPQAGAHDVIGDRAFGDTADQVARLGQAALDGLTDAGIVGVIKHIPGHGRAGADSHHHLPTVDADDAALATDIAPFKALAQAPMAMTAHVLYSAWDTTQCATLSASIIERVIRQRIGFDGLLMSDDLDMKALVGSVPELAVQSLAAGCDVALNCWGDMAVMVEIAARLGEASTDCRRRLRSAMAHWQPQQIDGIVARQSDCLARRDSVLRQLAAFV